MKKCDPLRAGTYGRVHTPIDKTTGIPFASVDLYSCVPGPYKIFTFADKDSNFFSVYAQVVEKGISEACLLGYLNRRLISADVTVTSTFLNKGHIVASYCKYLGLSKVWIQDTRLITGYHNFVKKHGGVPLINSGECELYYG